MVQLAGRCGIPLMYKRRTKALQEKDYFQINQKARLEAQIRSGLSLLALVLQSPGNTSLLPGYSYHHHIFRHAGVGCYTSERPEPG